MEYLPCQAQMNPRTPGFSKRKRSSVKWQEAWHCVAESANSISWPYQHSGKHQSRNKLPGKVKVLIEFPSSSVILFDHANRSNRKEKPNWLECFKILLIYRPGRRRTILWWSNPGMFRLQISAKRWQGFWTSVRAGEWTNCNIYRVEKCICKFSSSRGSVREFRAFLH